MKSFYGEPTELLVIETYIDLPTLEDYFSELAGAVKVRKSQGKKHFRFASTRPEMTIYDPLVLIDWVAVNDIKQDPCHVAKSNRPDRTGQLPLH